MIHFILFCFCWQIKEHVLITTLEHRRAVRILDEPARKEIEKYKKALMKYFMPYRVPIFYERACKSSHLQVHCVPIPNDKVKHLVPAAKVLDPNFILYITNELHTKSSFTRNFQVCFWGRWWTSWIHSLKKILHQTSEHKLRPLFL